MHTPLSLQDGRLSDRQVDAYWRDGFLFPIPVMPPDKAQALRGALEEIEATWLDADLPLPLNTYKRVNAHLVMPLAHQIGTDPAILDVIEGVLGPDILIFSVEFFIKEPRTTHIVSMHQDLTYWGLGAIDGLVTAWIALSPATPASGCMDFVRASHKNPILPHQDTFDENNLLSRGQEVRVDVADKDKVPIEIRPGEMSLHHGLTIHGSGPNTSDDRRIAAVVRYMRADFIPEGEKPFAFLARGADRGHGFEPTQPPLGLFDAAALAQYDHVRAAQTRIMMKDAAGTSKVY
jgi:hypothetical protein